MSRRNKSEDHSSVLKELKISKVILPAIIGIAVVMYMMQRQLHLEDLNSVQWRDQAIFWVSMGILTYIIRHLFYAWRLKIVSDDEFSWLKAMQLIVIWEFSSAVSPTSVGGSAVAFLLISQEKISAARTIAIVLYTMVLDTLFFIMTLIILYFIYGPQIIRPGMVGLGDIDGYGITFITVLLFMIGYGFLFFYGLFINPRSIKRIFIFVSKWRIMAKIRESMRNTAMDIETASKQITTKPNKFHILAFTATAGAWIMRFLVINCLILAFVPNIQNDFFDQMIIFSRGAVMYVVTAFSPTPGAAGVAEYLFGGFYSDYIPSGISVIIAIVWRLITYYSYLLIGVIIIPIWLRQILARRSHKDEELDIIV
ncbi:MAG: lysylphosphatidylglycerol synthase transmembrane domain-containing protein [Saprospiraceae bacterium]